MRTSTYSRPSNNRYVKGIDVKLIIDTIDRMYVAKTSGTQREFDEALNDVFFHALNQRMLHAS
jgi:hypothetical protein